MKGRQDSECEIRYHPELVLGHLFIARSLILPASDWSFVVILTSIRRDENSVFVCKTVVDYLVSIVKLIAVLSMLALYRILNRDVRRHDLHLELR